MASANVNAVSSETQRKRNKIQKWLRVQVWECYEGKNYRGTCFSCGDKLKSTWFECGHVISEANGGTIDISNLRPVHPECNKGMGATDMNTWLSLHADKSIVDRFNASIQAGSKVERATYRKKG